MVTVKCPQCPKTFTKPTQNRADQALKMHIGRSHSGRIQSPMSGSAAHDRRREKLLAKKRAYNKRYRHEHPEKIKGYNRRRFYRKQKQQRATEVLFNFCPRCGFNIHQAAIGIAAANNLK